MAVPRKARQPARSAPCDEPDRRPVVQFFVNPRPDPLARRRVDELRRAFADAGATVLVAPSASRALEIDPRAGHACAVGGDGTLRHVVDAVHRSGRAVTVSAYPTGTVNLLARERRYPHAPRAFARRVLGTGAVDQYTALVDGTPMLTCASVGPDAFAVQMLSSALKRRIGRLAYVVAFCRLLGRWPRPRLILECDGARIACEAVYVAKGRYFAGPWSVAPDARSTEPLLHVVALRDASRGRILRFAWAMLRAEPIDTIPGVQRVSCTRLAIHGPEGAPVQVDGDVEAYLPVTIALRREPTRFA